MPGPPPQTTAEQRERVLAPVAAGRSYSAVAAEVFGEARLRGRVERIVRREEHEGESLPPLERLLAGLPAEESQAVENRSVKLIRGWSSLSRFTERC